MRQKTAYGYVALTTGLGLMFLGNPGLALIALIPALALFSIDLIDQVKENKEKSKVRVYINTKKGE